jgi:peptide deformylase
MPAFPGMEPAIRTLPHGPEWCQRVELLDLSLYESDWTDRTFEPISQAAVGLVMTSEAQDHQPLPSLVYLGQQSLMRVSDPVNEQQIKQTSFQQQLETLARCMTAYGGIGIAAPQIGWNARVFCIGIDEQSSRYPNAELIPFEYWINPQISSSSKRSNWAWEGCLSVPGMRGWVQRPVEILVNGMDENGDRKERQYDGFAARVFQHEFDHLDGVLYPEKVADPGRLIPEVSLARQADWPADWPSRGARQTAPGELSDIA